MNVTARLMLAQAYAEKGDEVTAAFIVDEMNATVATFKLKLDVDKADALASVEPLNLKASLNTAVASLPVLDVVLELPNG